MNQKPSDIFLSIIDFFGILIPGAILTYLHGDLLLRPFGLSISKLQTPTDWIPAFFIAYILGQLLLSLSQLLNRPAIQFPKKEMEDYYQEVCASVKLPSTVSRNITNVYYSAYSFINIHSPEAMAELERQAAEYKLFRSLMLLFLLDIPLAVASNQLSPIRLISSFLIVGFAAYRFWWLLNWTYRLAFDYYLQLQKPVIVENKKELS